MKFVAVNEVDIHGPQISHSSFQQPRVNRRAAHSKSLRQKRYTVPCPELTQKLIIPDCIGRPSTGHRIEIPAIQFTHSLGRVHRGIFPSM
jgi:hypothetical protein